MWALLGPGMAVAAPMSTCLAPCGELLVNGGLDDAFVVGLGGRKGLSVGPHAATVSVLAEVPWADLDLADHRLTGDLILPLVEGERWMLAGRTAVLWRRLDTHMNTMGNVGLAGGVLGGWTAQRGWLAGELGLDHAAATRIVHKAAYRELVYADAVDGWYRNTGTTLDLGLRAGLRVRRAELGLRVGQTRSLQLQTQTLTQTQTVPFYASLGVAWQPRRFGASAANSDDDTHRL